MSVCNSNVFYDDKRINCNDRCNLDYNVASPKNFNDELITEINVEANDDAPLVAPIDSVYDKADECISAYVDDDSDR